MPTNYYRRALGGGNWTDAASWETGSFGSGVNSTSSYPGAAAGDTAYFVNGSGNLTVNATPISGVILLMSGYTGTLTVSNQLNVVNACSLGGTLSGASSLSLSGYFPVAITQNGATVSCGLIFTGTTSVTLGDPWTTTGPLTFASGAAVTVATAGFNVSVGAITVNATSVTFTGAGTVASTSVNLGAGTLTISSNWTVTGSFTFSGSGTVSGAYNVNVGGGLAWTTITTGAGTATFVMTGTGNLNGTTGALRHNLVINTAGTITMPAGTTMFFIGVTVTYTAGTLSIDLNTGIRFQGTCVANGFTQSHLWQNIIAQNASVQLSGTASLKARNQFTAATPFTITAMQISCVAFTANYSVIGLSGAKVTISGTGTISGSASIGIDIDLTGNTTISGTVIYGNNSAGCTLKYVSGTVTTTGSTLTVGGATDGTYTLNLPSANVPLVNLTFNNASSTYVITNAMACSGLLSVAGGTITTSGITTSGGLSYTSGTTSGAVTLTVTGGTITGGGTLNTSLTLNGTITVASDLGFGGPNNPLLTYSSGTITIGSYGVKVDGNCRVSTNGLTLPHVTINSDAPTLTMAANMQCTTFRSASYSATLAGAYTLTCANFAVGAASSAITLTIPPTGSVVVTGALAALAGATAAGTGGTPSIVSATPSTPATLTYQGTAANCMIQGASLTDISLAASFLGCNWQGSCLRCSGVVAIAQSNIQNQFTNVM